MKMYYYLYEEAVAIRNQFLNSRNSYFNTDADEKSTLTEVEIQRSAFEVIDDSGNLQLGYYVLFNFSNQKKLLPFEFAKNNKLKIISATHYAPWFLNK